MEKKNLAQQTAERLYARIVLEKQIAPGEKLPNELELAQALGAVSYTHLEFSTLLTTQAMEDLDRRVLSGSAWEDGVLSFYQGMDELYQNAFGTGDMGTAGYTTSSKASVDWVSMTVVAVVLIFVLASV